MSQLVLAAGMSAVAGQFRGFARIATVLAAIFFAGSHAVAGWMSAFLGVCHFG
jgi:hypothetical protein